MIEIVLAGAPMGKERVKRGAAGNAYTPERTVRFESRLAFEAQHVMNGRPLLEGPLEIEVVALMPVPESKPAKWKAAALLGVERPTKKPDWDNVAKILDALNMIVWRDDAQIVGGTVEKHYSAKPMTLIRVSPATVKTPPLWAQKHEPYDLFA